MLQEPIVIDSDNEGSESLSSSILDNPDIR